MTDYKPYLEPLQTVAYSLSIVIIFLVTILFLSYTNENDTNYNRIDNHLTMIERNIDGNFVQASREHEGINLKINLLGNQVESVGHNVATVGASSYDYALTASDILPLYQDVLSRKYNIETRIVVNCKGKDCPK